MRAGENRQKQKNRLMQHKCKSQVRISLQRLAIIEDRQHRRIQIQTSARWGRGDQLRHIRETPAPREVKLMPSSVIPRRKDLSTFPRGRRG